LRIRGKLYPSISVHQTMKGAQISVKFASSNSTWDDFMFDGDFSKAENSEPFMQIQPESDLAVSPLEGLFIKEPILDENIILGDDDDDDFD
jgi:hypothetical protein